MIIWGIIIPVGIQEFKHGEDIQVPGEVPTYLIRIPVHPAPFSPQNVAESESVAKTVDPHQDR